MPRTTSTQKQDVRYLERHAPKRGTPIPPVVSLTIAQLDEIERLAYNTLNLAQIAQRLQIRADIWEQIVQHNVAVKEAFLRGFSKFQEQALSKLAAGVLAGDPGLLRLAADRGLLGQQWEPKNKPALVVTPAAGAVQIDVVSSVKSAFERQTALLEADGILAPEDD